MSGVAISKLLAELLQPLRAGPTGRPILAWIRTQDFILGYFRVLPPGGYGALLAGRRFRALLAGRMLGTSRWKERLRHSSAGGVSNKSSYLIENTNEVPFIGFLLTCIADCDIVIAICDWLIGDSGRLSRADR